MKNLKISGINGAKVISTKAPIICIKDPNKPVKTCDLRNKEATDRLIPATPNVLPANFRRAPTTLTGPCTAELNNLRLSAADIASESVADLASAVNIPAVPADDNIRLPIIYFFSILINQRYS